MEDTPYVKCIDMKKFHFPDKHVRLDDDSDGRLIEI